MGSPEGGREGWRGGWASESAFGKDGGVGFDNASKPKPKNPVALTLDSQIIYIVEIVLTYIFVFCFFLILLEILGKKGLGVDTAAEKASFLPFFPLLD